MILIVAGNLDDQAKLLKAKWHDGNATLLLVDDLTSPGWKISAKDFSASEFVAEGVVRSVKEVTGIINILPTVAPYELFKIVKDDREYVATELNAFLFYFLSKFHCRILNRPSAFNLSGPSIAPQEWIKECVKASLPVYSKTLNSGDKFYFPSENNLIKSATFFNDTVYCDNKLDLDDEIKALAHNTELDYFKIHFKEAKSNYFFFAVSTYPDFAEKKSFARLQDYFNKTNK